MLPNRLNFIVICLGHEGEAGREGQAKVNDKA